MTPALKRAIVAVPFVFTIAAVYRSFSLMHNLADFDEAYHAAMAQLPLEDLLAMPQNFPPGFHLLLHGWVSLFGVSDPALRILAALLGLGGIAAGYALAYELTRSRPLANRMCRAVTPSPCRTPRPSPNDGSGRR